MSEQKNSKRDGFEEMKSKHIGTLCKFLPKVLSTLTIEYCFPRISRIPVPHPQKPSQTCVFATDKSICIRTGKGLCDELNMSFPIQPNQELKWIRVDDGKCRSNLCDHDLRELSWDIQHDGPRSWLRTNCIYCEDLFKYNNDHVPIKKGCTLDGNDIVFVCEAEMKCKIYRRSAIYGLAEVSEFSIPDELKHVAAVACDSGSDGLFITVLMDHEKSFYVHSTETWFKIETGYICPFADCIRAWTAVKMRVIAKLKCIVLLNLEEQELETIEF